METNSNLKSEDISKKLQVGFEKARKKLIEKEKKSNGYFIISDKKGNTHSCIIDGTLTSVIGNHLKIVAWFDNE